MKKYLMMSFSFVVLGSLSYGAGVEKESSNLGLLPNSLTEANLSGMPLPPANLPGEEELGLDDPSALLEMEEQSLVPPDLDNGNRFLSSEEKRYLNPQQVEEKGENIPLLPPLASEQRQLAAAPRIPMLAAKDPLPAMASRTVSNTVAENVVTPPPAAPATPAVQPVLNFAPLLGGVAVPAVPAEPVQQSVKTQNLPVPGNATPMPPLKGVPDVAVILSNNQFFPAKIRLKAGMQTRLIFTTINKKPAALVIERLQIQRWIAKENEKQASSELERSRWEVNRELVSSKVTEINLDPKPGIYAFHDAITGATGEINVE